MKEFCAAAKMFLGVFRNASCWAGGRVAMVALSEGQSIGALKGMPFVGPAFGDRWLGYIVVYTFLVESLFVWS